MPVRQPSATGSSSRPHHLALLKTRATRGGVTALASLSLALAGGLALPSSVSAAPAPEAPTVSFAPGETVTGTVPAGTCSVTATVTGGAGGRSAPGANGVGANGAGARITATFAGTPGTTFSGTVGGGGQQNAGRTGGIAGVNGGGAGGTGVDDHGGAGGGGFSALFLGGSGPDDLVVQAGGGGGSGGGHSITEDGFGGDAGLPAAPGASGAGESGTNGFEGGPVVGGGAGGTAVAPGAGGAHETDATLNGLSGAGSVGGAGAPDPNYDAGGGGGGGVFGGGGGASTIIKNGDGGINTVAGAGGGGGSSFVSATAEGLVATAYGNELGTGAGQDGSISLDWVPCAYDLGVTKTFVVDGAPAGSPELAPIGSTITWTVTVRNDGPEAMTRGDLVTLTDTLPGAGPKTLTAVSVAGGASTQLERGPVTCDTTVGSPMPATLVCARDFALVDGVVDGRRGLDVDETLTVEYTQTVTDTAATVLDNTATVTDRGNPSDNSATATVTVIGPPVATDDSDLGNTIGDPVSLTVLDNDTAVSAALDPSSLELWDPATGTSLGTTLDVPGEGTWTVDTVTGRVTFVPDEGFLVDPTPVGYRITDANGLTAVATVTVAYLPQALDDSDLANIVGDTVLVDVLGNDEGDLDPSTVVLVGGSDAGKTLVVAGEGTWTVDPATGSVTFAPEAGFTTDPTPVAYEVTDSTGDTVSATVTVGYVPDAVDDSDLRNTIGDVVTVDVLGNDVGDFVPSTVVLVGGSDSGKTLVVAGEGTWTVDPMTGSVTFTPEPGFRLNPTPVAYEVTDSTGDTTSATVTVTYLPESDDDASLGNTLGEPVVVDVLPNDTGDFDTSTLYLVDPRTGDRVRTLTVRGQGVWTVDSAAGTVTFTPEAEYYGNPTPVTYEVLNTAGDPVTAEVVITFVPRAQDDVDEDNVSGSTVVVDVVGNDRGTLDPASVRLVTPGNGALVTSLVVAGEGTWGVDPATGAISFVPLAGFVGDPTPVGYQVTDVEGNLTTAQVRITYLDPAAQPTAPATPGPQPASGAGALAVTGWAGAGLAALAVLLVLVGTATTSIGRRWLTRA